MIRFENKLLILIVGSAVTLMREHCVDANDAEFGRIITYDNFDHFKASMNKTYDHDHEEARSRKAYEENCRKIREHNMAAQKGKYSFEVRANCFADLTHGLYMKKYLRLGPSPHVNGSDHGESMLGSVHDANAANEVVPDSLDWRHLGFRTSTKNQKSCGSCYAFSIAMSIEGQIFKRTGKLVSLSEQQIIDCSVETGNHGCGGGTLRNTLEYLASTRGLMRAVDYPYTSSQDLCDYRPALAVVNITNWAILPQRNEEAMKRAIATIGPIAISINASPRTFQIYSHGIYDDPECSDKNVNHAMLAVGYTPEYFILKNWWGDKWGENGYMKIRRHRNMCGLSNYAAYAAV